jgi:hypothetical protein
MDILVRSLHSTLLLPITISDINPHRALCPVVSHQ